MTGDRKSDHDHSAFRATMAAINAMSARSSKTVVRPVLRLVWNADKCGDEKREGPQ